VINVRISGFAPAPVVTSRARRPGRLNFWILFALEASFIAGVLALVLAVVWPSRMPLARSADVTTIRDAVWARVNGTIDDPLTDIAPGISVRASSVRGFALKGEAPRTALPQRQSKKEIWYTLDERNHQIRLVQRSGKVSLMAGMWELPAGSPAASPKSETPKAPKPGVRSREMSRARAVAV
jgi:hypothetical protein